MSSTLICVTQNPELAYGIFIYLFIYLMCGCVGWSAPLFFANPHYISNGFFVHMFHSVGQDESAYMHSLAIASTAGLYKMINFIY